MKPKNVALISVFTLAFSAWSNILIAQGIISTKAGDGITEYLGDGGPALQSEMASPSAICVDANHNFYIADRFNHRIRKINAANIITTIAGTGNNGYSGDNGPATSAKLDIPTGIAIDAAGNLYITEYNNHTIRKIDHNTQVITTICGNGVPGYNGDGVQASTAQLYRPGLLCVDGSGNIYIPDTYNNRIRKITAATGVISTIAGTGTPGYNGDGQLAINAQVSFPLAVTVNAAGDVYFTDGNNRIRKISAATGNISTVAGNGTLGFSGDGAAATTAQLNQPQGICLDAAGNLYIADYGSNRIRKVSRITGVITSIAGEGPMGYTGDGGPAVYGRMWEPMGLVLDAGDSLFIAEAGNSIIRKVTPGVNAVNNVNGNDDLKIYPNPSSGRCVIECDAAATIDVYNLTGQQLYHGTTSTAKYNMDLTAQPAGMYFIYVKDEKGSRTAKLVITH